MLWRVMKTREHFQEALEMWDEIREWDVVLKNVWWGTNPEGTFQKQMLYKKKKAEKKWFPWSVPRNDNW